MNTLLRSSVAAFALGATVLTTTLPQPALADGRASTRNLILAGAAVLLLGGAAVNANHHRSNGNRVVGYLRDGSAVYADGHIVDVNGDAWNPADRGLQVACDGERCRLTQDDDSDDQDDSTLGTRDHRERQTTQPHHHRGSGPP